MQNVINFSFYVSECSPFVEAMQDVSRALEHWSTGFVIQGLRVRDSPLAAISMLVSSLLSQLLYPC